MIKLENTVTPSPEQWEAVIRGMRNPMNSWDKSDSVFEYDTYSTELGCVETHSCLDLGKADHELMMKLSSAGTDHSKFRRMIPVYVDIVAPLYWWKEFDTYKVGTVANSCSTMHKIHEKEFELDDFSTDKLISVSMYDFRHLIDLLNEYRNMYVNWDTEDKIIHETFFHDKTLVWYQLIQLLPSSYNQRRTVMLNYEVLANIYKARRNHKLNEWHTFCAWIENCLPYSEIIIGEKDNA